MNQLDLYRGKEGGRGRKEGGGGHLVSSLPHCMQ